MSVRLSGVLNLVYIWELMFSQVAAWRGVVMLTFSNCCTILIPILLHTQFATVVVYVSLVQKGRQKNNNNKHVTYISLDFQIKNR